MKARDVMVRNAIAVGPGASVSDVAKILLENGLSERFRSLPKGTNWPVLPPKAI